jgi:hypothetical protein
LWTACLGAAVAFGWNMIRNNNYSALRVAVFSCLGAGFGFAFGNFLQVLGQVSEIHFNFWNVMEYSLGFFGGLGLAYGTLTTQWEVEEEKTKQGKQVFQMVFLVFIIPFIMWQQNFEWERIQQTFSKLINGENVTLYNVIIWGSLLLIICAGIYWTNAINKYKELTLKEIRHFFFGHLALYMLLSFFITGAIISIYRIEQYLYLVNYIIIFLLIGKVEPIFFAKSFEPKKYMRAFFLTFIIIAGLAYIAVHSHGEMKNAKKRFGENTTLTEKPTN